MYANLRNSASHRKARSRNTKMTSDFRPKVEICSYRACAIKNMQYNPYLVAESPTFFVETVRSLVYWANTTFHRTYY